MVTKNGIIGDDEPSVIFAGQTVAVLQYHWSGCSWLVKANQNNPQEINRSPAVDVWLMLKVTSKEANISERLPAWLPSVNMFIELV